MVVGFDVLFGQFRAPGFQFRRDGDLLGARCDDAGPWGRYDGFVEKNLGLRGGGRLGPNQARGDFGPMHTARRGCGTKRLAALRRVGTKRFKGRTWAHTCACGSDALCKAIRDGFESLIVRMQLVVPARDEVAALNEVEPARELSLDGSERFIEAVHQDANDTGPVRLWNVSFLQRRSKPRSLLDGPGVVVTVADDDETGKAVDQTGDQCPIDSMNLGEELTVGGVVDVILRRTPVRVTFSTIGQGCRRGQGRFRHR